jgi:hypothetical protein
MRPFADVVQALPRMVRDLARGLGKQVRLDIVGAGTQVDRDILEKLEAPLGCAMPWIMASSRLQNGQPAASPAKAWSVLKPVTALANYT